MQPMPNITTSPAEQPRAADPAATMLEQAHARYGRGLLRFFSQRLGARADAAEELAQRTWATLWQVLLAERYDANRARLSTFLYAIAYRVWLKHARATTHRSLEAADEFAASLIDADDPERVLIGAERIDAMRHCLSHEGTAESLTAEERAVVLALSHERSERELAGELGLAPSTVHERKKSAYAKLRRCLARKGVSAESAERPPPPW